MRVHFGPFLFDSATRELLQDEERVHLSPKSFDLLQILIERRPAMVAKSELQDRLWPDVEVLEANLGNAAAEIRKALGDDPKSPKYIATVSRRGYRFCAAVEEKIAAGGAPGHHPPSFGWGEHRRATPRKRHLDRREQRLESTRVHRHRRWARQRRGSRQHQRDLGKRHEDYRAASDPEWKRRQVWLRGCRVPRMAG